MFIAGTSWYLGDLHVHTPFSNNYGQEGVTAEALHSRLAGLDFAVIADHNTFEGYCHLLEQRCSDSPILFPGVELLLPGGFSGLSLLAVFDPRLSPGELELLLRQLGIEVHHQGDPTVILSGSLKDIADTLNRYGAVAIWTEVQGPTGILQAVDQKQRQFILGLGWPGNLMDCNHVSEGEPEDLIRVYSSNAHKLSEIGKLFTRVKVENLDFAGLKFALQHPKGRIAKGQPPCGKVQPHIARIRITGGFFEQDFALSPGLNCIVGSRGTGKTTLLKLLEFALDGPEREELAVLLGHGEVAVKLFDGREYLQVKRKLGHAPQVQDRFGRCLNFPLRDFACFYSQGEIEQIMLNPEVQLELLDGLWDSTQALAQKAALTTELDRNRVELLILEQELESLEDQLAGKRALELRLSELDNYPLRQIQDKLALRDRELLSIAGARQLIRRHKQILRNFPNPCSTPGLPEFLGQVLEQNRLLAGEMLRSWEGAEEQLDSFQAEAEIRHAGLEQEYQEQLGGFVDNRVKQLVQERERVQAELITLEPFNHRQRELSEQVQTLKRQRKRLLDEWEKLGEDIYKLRWQTAARINSELPGLIRVEVARQGLTKGFSRFLNEAPQPLGAATVRTIVKHTVPGELLTLLRAIDVEGLALKTGLSPERCQRVMVMLSPNKLQYALESLELPDLVTLYLKEGEVEKAGSMLSTGQRCTAVLPLLLMSARPPLIMDQPEDQLDNSYVYQVLVDKLRRLKEERQFIFATHNPNIPVLADAEQILVLQADGRQGTLRSAGSIEKPAIKELIQSIMEGGKDAFARRAQCYGQLAP